MTSFIPRLPFCDLSTILHLFHICEDMTVDLVFTFNLTYCENFVQDNAITPSVRN